MDIKGFFDKYVSNTLIGVGNQHFFNSEGEKTAYAFYKVFKSGSFGYSFLFSNATDSTCGEGNFCHANISGKPWNLLGMEVFVSDTAHPSTAFRQRQTILFGGKAQKRVEPGEWFYSDETVLSVKENEYLGLKITFCGEQLPCMSSNLIPSFVENKGKFVSCDQLPLPAMVGCLRKPKKRLVFWGDSITQGCGTEENSYSHYAAVAAKLLGNEYSVWNIGIGWARAYDAASDGYWMQKALQSDVAFVCFGVNDICAGRTPEQVLEDLNTITEKLKTHGTSVVLQTIPPFSIGGEIGKRWHEINQAILCGDVKSADYVFDNREILGIGENFAEAKYNPHPNGQGCKAWGQALYEFVMKNKIL